MLAMLSSQKQQEQQIHSVLLLFYFVTLYLPKYISSSSHHKIFKGLLSFPTGEKQQSIS